MLLENDALNNELIALPRFQHQVIPKIADSNKPGGRDAALTNGVFNYEVVADEAEAGKPLLRLKSD